MEIWQDMMKSKIFEGLDERSIKALNFCFKSRLKFIQKNEIIVSEADKNEYCIYILDGKAKSVNINDNGVETIINIYKKGDLFGLTEAYVNAPHYKNTLIATEKSTIVLLNRYRFIYPCENRCMRHRILEKNLHRQLANDNIELNNKISLLTKRSIREKILAYLKRIQEKEGKDYFDIPLNRQELANYLAVDRSALSIELSKMKKENLIDFTKNHFNLK